jgi:hypothetical protein
MIQDILDGIAVRRSQLIHAQHELADRLAAAESRIGEDYLAGDKSSLRVTADIQAEIDAIERALAVLDLQEARAKLDQRRAEAAELRAQAVAKRAELERHDSKVAKLLASLGALEGIEFDSSILCAMRRGSWQPVKSLASDFAFNLPLSLRNPREMAPEFGWDIDPESYYFVPRSRQLRKEIAGLEGQAALIDAEVEAALTVKPAPLPRVPGAPKLTSDIAGEIIGSQPAARTVYPMETIDQKIDALKKRAGIREPERGDSWAQR